MRKLIFAFTALLFSQFSFGQTVQDNATIPVSVTLNSILRLQVKTGGNIQFVFNTMEQYANGIPNTNGTTTTFTVASSKSFTVSLGAEDDALYGVETGDRDLAGTPPTGTGNIPLTVIQYTVVGTAAMLNDAATLMPLTQVSAATYQIIDAGVAGPADAARQFDIEWEAGTVTNLLALNAPADVYITNVFLNLQAY